MDGSVEPRRGEVSLPSDGLCQRNGQRSEAGGRGHTERSAQTHIDASVLERLQAESPFLDFSFTKGLHIMHLNVRSLFSKLDEIRLMMCNSKVGIVCFSETWLDASISDTEIEIENYVVLRKDRNRSGGGVCVYIRADICFNRRMDLNHDLIEAVWFDVQLIKSKPILIGALYRPLDQNNFYQLLEESFVPCSDFKDEVIMIGDFNTDVSNKEHGLYIALNRFCQVFDLQQLIQEPRRVAKMSQTVIDLILVSEQSMISQSGVVNCTMSDHSLIYCTRKKYKVVLKKQNTIKIRSLKKYSREVFIECLNSLNWSLVLCSDVDEAWGQFKNMFLEAVDKVAPIKTIRVKLRSEPWMNGDILEAISKRNKAFSVFRKSKEQYDLDNYKKLRNIVQKMIQTCKKDFFRDKLTEHKGNPKKLCQSLKQ